VRNGVEFANGTRYISAQVRTPCVSGRTNRIAETIVKLEKDGESFAVKTKVLIGADGAQSRVARDLKLDENKEWIVGYEEVWKNISPEDEPRLHCFLDARLAPGYLTWITNDGEETPKSLIREMR
jgi:flavin-dependent dehydrogenase